MVTHHKRRRRKPVEAVVAGEEDQPPALRKRVRSTPPTVFKSKLRPIYRIASDLFDAHPDFGIGTGKKRSKVYTQFRGLFCIANIRHVFTEREPGMGEVIAEWPGEQVVTEWLEGTKTSRSKAVKLLRSELEDHLKEVA